MNGGDGGRKRGRSSPAAARGLRQLAAAAPLTVTVRGGSMMPVLTDGQRVRIAGGRYLPGDLVAFRCATGQLIVHRLCGVLPGGRLVTRADATGVWDPPLPAAAVVGRVITGGDDAPAVKPVDRLAAVARFLVYVARRYPDTGGGSAPGPAPVASASADRAGNRRRRG